MYLYKVVLDEGRHIVVWSSPSAPSFYEPGTGFDISGVQHVVQLMVKAGLGDGVDGIIYAVPAMSRANAA